MRTPIGANDTGRNDPWPAPVWGGAGAGLASLALLAPWFRPGALLVRDLVAVPDPAWSWSLVAAGDRLPRDIPGEVVVAAAGQFAPADLLVRVIVIAALVWLGAGVGRLLRDAPPLAATVGGTVAVWNPYVLARLHQGQWLVLLPLAALPWIVVHLQDDDPWRLVRTMALASLSGFLSIVIAVPTMLVVGIMVRRFRAALAGFASAVVMALPWIVVTGDVVADPDGVRAFAPNADLAGGLLPSLLTGGGYFNADVASPWRSRWPVAIVALSLTAVAIVGLLQWVRRGEGAVSRARSGLLVVGVLALGWAVFAATGVGQRVLVEVVEAVPASSVVRDAQRLLAPWVVGLAVGAGAAATSIGGWSGAPVGTAAVLAVAALVSLPDPIVGPRLPAPSSLPQAWNEASQLVNDGPEGAVLVVPYGQTQRYAFTDHRPVAVPLIRTMRPPVAVDTRLVVGDLAVDDVAPSDPLRGLAARDLATLKGQELASSGLSWVAVTDPGRFVSSPASGVAVALTAPSIQLLRVEPPLDPRAVRGTDPPGWLVATDLVIAAAFLALLVAPLVRSRRQAATSGERSDTATDQRR